MTSNEQIGETIDLFRQQFPIELTALTEQGAENIGALGGVEKADETASYTFADPDAYF